jgi:TPR repeat protein
VEANLNEADKWLQAGAEQGYGPAVAKLGELRFLRGLEKPVAAVARNSVRSTIEAWKSTPVRRVWRAWLLGGCRAQSEVSQASRVAAKMMLRRRGAVSPENTSQDIQKGFAEEFDRALTAAAQGHYAAAVAPLKRCHRLRPDDMRIPYNLAACSALAGDHKEGAKWLTQAVELGLGENELAQDPDYKTIFGDNRYRRILRKAREKTEDAAVRYLRSALTVRSSH